MKSWKFPDGKICQTCPNCFFNDPRYYHGSHEGTVIEVKGVKHDFPHGDSEIRWVEKKE